MANQKRSESVLSEKSDHHTAKLRVSGKKARKEMEANLKLSGQNECYSHDDTCQEKLQNCDTSKTDSVSNDTNLQAVTSVENSQDHEGEGCLEGQTESGYTSFSEFLRELGQESKMVMLQYSQTFTDSEAYEQQACQHVVDLTTHASILEKKVNEKKKILHDRLKEILQILSFNSDDNF